ncbi:MAG: DUF2807 domain-containing protein, partial [Muribaculaceae bacterium]|nr:DUF2807 domain-containing protein [Muribaculaceae bacterium]
MKRVFITMLAIVTAMMQMAVMAAQEPTQRRAQVKQYSELEFGLPVNARVVYDRQKAGLIEYMATDEAQKHIKMECVDGRLVCSYAKGRSSRSGRNESQNALKSMVIYTYGSLSEVKVKGVGSVSLDENILKQQPRLVVTGVGNITASKVRPVSLAVEITGTGLVKIEDLKLNADGCLNVDNRGVGRIY